MPVFMFLLVLALPVTVLTVSEIDKPEPPKLCTTYNVHEGRLVDGPCHPDK